MRRIGRLLFALTVVSCATPAKNTSSPLRARSMTMRKPPSAPQGVEGDDQLRAVDALPVPQRPANIVVFTDLGYQVRIPEGWGYATDIGAGGDAFDIVLSHEVSRTSVNIATYWDDDTHGKVTLDDVAWFHHRRMERGGNAVTDERFDVTDKAYVISFDAVRQLPGRLIAFRVVCVRLHRFPGPVIAVFGISPAKQGAFMRKSVEDVISGIEPYSGEDGP